MSTDSSRVLSSAHLLPLHSFFFFFNDTATTEIYTLSLHDALPISVQGHLRSIVVQEGRAAWCTRRIGTDRKSTRLNSSHLVISYAVFCLKKKKIITLTSHSKRLNQAHHHCRCHMLLPVHFIQLLCR